MTDARYRYNPVFHPGKEDPIVLNQALNDLRDASVALDLVQSCVDKKIFGLGYKDHTTTLQHARAAVSFLDKAKNTPGTRLWVSIGDIAKKELPQDALVTFVKKEATSKRKFAQIVRSMTEDIAELRARCLHELDQTEEKKQSEAIHETMRELP